MLVPVIVVPLTTLKHPKYFVRPQNHAIGQKYLLEDFFQSGNLWSELKKIGFEMGMTVDFYVDPHSSLKNPKTVPLNMKLTIQYSNLLDYTYSTIV